MLSTVKQIVSTIHNVFNYDVVRQYKRLQEMQAVAYKIGRHDLARECQKQIDLIQDEAEYIIKCGDMV